MKLRIKGDSLRIRVTQAELRTFAEQGRVEDCIRFPPGRTLVYRLTRDAQSSQLTARYEADTIELRIPEASARQWAESDLVTLTGQQAGDSVELRIFVEKDFACLQPREGEDESDHFPNPAIATGAIC